MRVLLLASLFLIGCAEPESDPYPCLEVATIDDARPDILVIGDSISMGYTPYIRASLSSQDVVHNLCNAMDSNNGVNRIDIWLNQRPSWYAITFNHGLWDAASWVSTSDSTYASNLTYIANRIKAKTSRPLFVLSTDVLPGTPYRNDTRVQQMNAIAATVMAAQGIPILDLHAFSQTIQSDHVSPNDVHFTSAGSSLLANEILSLLSSLYGIN